MIFRNETYCLYFILSYSHNLIMISCSYISIHPLSFSYSHSDLPNLRSVEFGLSAGCGDCCDTCCCDCNDCRKFREERKKNPFQNTLIMRCTFPYSYLIHFSSTTLSLFHALCIRGFWQRGKGDNWRYVITIKVTMYLPSIDIPLLPPEFISIDYAGKAEKDYNCPDIVLAHTTYLKSRSNSCSREVFDTLDALALVEFIFDHGLLQDIPAILQINSAYMLVRKQPLSEVPSTVQRMRIQGQYSLPDDVHSILFSGLQFGNLEVLSLGYYCCKKIHTASFSSIFVFVHYKIILIVRHALFGMYCNERFVLLRCSWSCIRQ